MGALSFHPLERALCGPTSCFYFSSFCDTGAIDFWGFWDDPHFLLNPRPEVTPLEAADGGAGCGWRHRERGLP